MAQSKTLVPAKKIAKKNPKKPASKKISDSPKKATKPSQKKIMKSGGVKSLTADEVFHECPLTAFKFKDTKVLAKTHEIISQDRAVRAIEMGLGIRKPGYNIYVAGSQGTGKASVIRTFLEKFSAGAETPVDYIYVYDFDQTEQPKAIPLAPGVGRKFKKDMDALIKTLREEIPNALQSEDYENAVNAYMSASNDRKSKLFSDLEKRAKSLDFQLKSTRMGIETIPVVDGRSLTEKEYGKLQDVQRGQIEDKRSQLEPEVLDFARKVRAIEHETKEYVDKLRQEVGLQIVNGYVEPLAEKYKEIKPIVDFLGRVRDHILENILDFVEAEEPAPPQDMELPPHADGRDRFRRYKVNVFVDNTQTKGGPVITESNPTYYNLFGRIEKNVENGMYLTDFTMIKAGAIHRANGGYLVLNAVDVFRTPSIWDTLKRILKNRLGYIEDMGEQYSLLPTSGLRPEPIPLEVKVILIGNDEIYHLLHDMDEDFRKIFKIKADFDSKMDRNQSNINSYASFVATRTQIEKLLPFDKGGVAAIVEFGSRLVEDQRLLSTQFGDLKDLTIEADFIAREQDSRAVKRDHVEAALDQKFFRVNLVEENLMKMVRNADILLQVDGKRVGQVNGLAVYDMGDYSFGKISRITCTTAATGDGIINVERASKLSGKIHDKGIMILTGFLNSVFARKHGIGMSASVCFEQSYGLIDGDSATVAEFVAIISALSGIPIMQALAMTGSANQFGDVQPVGGINEKIEGFYKTCKLLGKGREYTVLIPAQNAPNLMLHRGARQAVADGFLKIYPVMHVSEAWRIATGTELGITDIHNDPVPTPGSAMAIVAERLEQIHREKHKHHDKDAAKNKKIASPETEIPTKKRAAARQVIQTKFRR